MSEHHPLIVQAKALAARLRRMAVYCEEYPQYSAVRLYRLSDRADRRYWRRARALTPPQPPRKQRMGRASTQDRPYAVGGRGRRGW